VDPAIREGEAWQLDARATRTERRRAAWVTLAGFTLSVLLGLASRGVYHEDDICHFHMAWMSWSEVDSLLNQWGRPGYNLPTCVVAHFFGVQGCRLFSAIQTAVVAWLAYLIARRALPRAGMTSAWAPWAAAFVWLQPVTLILSLTTLTETTAALYLALGLWLYLRGNRVGGCLAFGALFVTRYEFLALSPLLAYLVGRDALAATGGDFRRALRQPWPWACAAAALVLPVLYCVAAWWADLPPAVSPLYTFARPYPTTYGSGGLHEMPLRWVAQAGAAVVALALAGSIALGRRGAVLTVAVLATVALHALLWWGGKFATGGYPRFFVPLSGPVAVLAAAGLAASWRGRRWAIGLLPLVALGSLGVGIALWPHVLPGWFQPFALRFAVALLVLALAAGGLPLFIRGDRVRVASRVAAVLMLALALAQLTIQVRPLKLENRAHHPLVHEAALWIERERPPGAPIITGLTSFHLMRSDVRDRVQWVRSPKEARDAWTLAAPGAMFVALDRPDPGPWDAAEQARLEEDLRRLEVGGAASFVTVRDGYILRVHTRADPATDGGRDR
jgi:hypothetical protein